MSSDDASERQWLFVGRSTAAPEPPLGIEIIRADELDPIAGRSDRWIFTGVVGKRSVIRSGFGSAAAACRAAWAAVRGVTGLHDDDPEAAEASEPERYQLPTWTKPPTMHDTYTIKVGTWDSMAADLISQVIHDAGSLRRAAKIIGVPRSTLSARVRDYVSRGVWPRTKADP
jgi:hypothetical protein